MKKIICINSLGEVCPKGRNTLGDDETKKHPLYNTIKKVWALQYAVNDGFMRIWWNNGKLLASVEFIAFVDQRALWRGLRERLKSLGADVVTLYIDKHLNEFKKKGDRKWRHGPNHGRMESQISADWKLPIKISAKKAKAFKSKIKKALKWEFYNHGVNVI